MRLKPRDLEVASEELLHFVDRHLFRGFREHRERAARLRLDRKTRRQGLHDREDAGVVIKAIPAIVARIGLREIKRAVLRVVEPMLLGPADHRWAPHEVRVLRFVLLQPALVSGREILVLRDPDRDPLMARAGFEVPEFLRVDERDTKAFACALRLNDVAEDLSAFARRARPREDHLHDVVLCDPGLFNVRIKLQRVIPREDGFSARDPDPGGIEPRCSMDACLPVRDRGVAERVFRKRILEVIRAMVVGSAIHPLLVCLRRVHHHVLRLEGVRIRVAANDEGAVRCRPRPHEERRARVRGA